MKDDICKNTKVSVREEGSGLVVRISGAFDSSTTPLIHECCKSIKNKKGVRHITLDFSEVSRADTSAFACIISFIKEHIGSSVEINIANLHKSEEDLLRILKLEKMVRII